jgi:ABC-type multidrug transport system fused ATPase/permease subunit
MFAFSIWNALWVVFVTFLFVNVIVMFFPVVADPFHDHEMGGGKKAMWAIVLLIFPLLGILIYLIVRGGGMAERSLAAQQQAKESVDSYIRDVAGGPASELERAASLRAAGSITDDEYGRLKARILG